MVRDKVALIFKYVNDCVVLDTVTEVIPLGQHKFVVKSGIYSGLTQESFNDLSNMDETPLFLDLDTVLISDKKQEVIPSIFVINNDYVDELQERELLTRVEAMQVIAEKAYSLDLVPDYENYYCYAILRPEKYLRKIPSPFTVDKICELLSTDVVNRNDYLPKEENSSGVSVVVPVFNAESILNTLNSRREEWAKEANENIDSEVDYADVEEIQEDDAIDIKATVEELSKKYIGQEKAIKSLLSNILLSKSIIEDLEYEGKGVIDEAELDARKINILLDGDTGTGKTAMVRDIAKKLHMPVAQAGANSFSETGYVGPTITDLLKTLLRKSNYDLYKAERGIIILDEVDKIASTKERNNSQKRGVQEELLAFITGYTYEVNMGSKGKFEFDTSKLIFVMLAAFTDIKKEKIDENEKNNIGFDTTGTTKKKTYTITREDLEKYGLQKEFIGRIKLFTFTKSYTKNDLRDILLYSVISPIKNFEKNAKLLGYNNVIISDKLLDAIVDIAYEKNTGGRSLQSTMNDIQDVLLYDLMTGEYKDEVIEINEDILEKVKQKNLREY